MLGWSTRSAPPGQRGAWLNPLIGLVLILALTGGGPAGATETLATEIYKQAFSLGQFGFGSSLALVLTVIILAFAILQQYFTLDRDAGKA